MHKDEVCITLMSAGRELNIASASVRIWRYTVVKKHYALRSFLSAVTVMSLTLSFLPTATAQPPKPSGSPMKPSDPASFTSDQEQLSNGISNGFETFFTEVIYEESPGDWAINYDDASEMGLSREDADIIAAFMGSPDSYTDGAAVTTYDLGTFGQCVVSNALGFPLTWADGQEVGRYLKNKQWKLAADKIVSLAAVYGATASLEYGIKALGGPAVWAGQLALYAGSCAVSEQIRIG